jgi:hypothetical protein
MTGTLLQEVRRCGRPRAGPAPAAVDNAGLPAMADARLRTTAAQRLYLKIATLPDDTSTLRTALRNMAWVLGDKALAMLLGLLIFGLIARALGPAGSGHFAYATALLQVGLGLSLVCSCRVFAA